MKKNPILTEEERDILLLVALHPTDKHLTNEEIGQRLGISVTRVKTLLHQICGKLEASNRNQAVFFAMRQGEMTLDDLFSLDELANVLISIGPDILRGIAQLLRQDQEREQLKEMFEKTAHPKKRNTGLLTNRERDVLALVSYGFTNKEIANQLCMSTSSIRTFLNRAFKKLGARKRADALQLALKNGEIYVSDISTLDEFIEFLTPLGAETIEEIATLQDQLLGNSN